MIQAFFLEIYCFMGGWMGSPEGGTIYAERFIRPGIPRVYSNKDAKKEELT